MIAVSARNNKNSDTTTEASVGHVGGRLPLVVACVQPFQALEVAAAVEATNRIQSVVESTDTETTSSLVHGHN